MHMDDYTQFCADWLAAWTGNEPEKLLAYYTDDAFYRDPARPHGLQGKVELRKYLERLHGEGGAARRGRQRDEDLIGHGGSRYAEGAGAVKRQEAKPLAGVPRWSQLSAGYAAPDSMTCRV